MGTVHSNPMKEIVYQNGEWRRGRHPIIGPRDHAMWLSSVVFDGARAFRGVVPDLLPHCARVINSAKILGMAPMLTAEEIFALAMEGIAKFPADAELYICPMFYATEGFISPLPQSTQFVLSVYEAALPEEHGITACLSSFRRPAKDMAPTEAKASCLYPNSARIDTEAKNKGFDTAVVLDPTGNVAEFGYMNLFMVKDGDVLTPAINGTFLNGITRQRVITLLTEAGLPVRQCAVTAEMLETADELFATGNYAKLLPCVRYEQKDLAIGPIYRQARSLYFEGALAGRF